MRCFSPASMRDHSACGDDARQKIGGDDALGRLRVGIDGEGDALLQEALLAGLLAAAKLIGRQRGHARGECCVMGAHIARPRQHLVIGRPQRIGGIGGPRPHLIQL